VIKAYHAILNALKARWGVQQFRLVGYSGGAQIALLLAAERKDVVGVIGVAGNLNHRAWTDFHRITPLQDSMPVSHLARNLAGVDQTYWFGEKDGIVNAQMFEAFLQEAARYAPVKRIEAAGFDHGCCWIEAWPAFWRDLAQ
jgi:pimeloyl-ACP methyl ester carboxylesterase